MPVWMIANVVESDGYAVAFDGDIVVFVGDR
jgi:hypothetical protein